MEPITSIVLASSNQGKIRELSELLDAYNIEIIPQSYYQVEEITETGLTFVENAILKARNAAKITGLPAAGDDSGLVVDALNGAPGIFSARYAGPQANDQNNITKLLTDLKDVPIKERSARFICVIAFLRHVNDPFPIIGQGMWEGSILFEPVGEQGFGYDPVFYVPTHQCSAAELSLTEKNRLSHRAQAMQKLVEKLVRLNDEE